MFLRKFVPVFAVIALSGCGPHIASVPPPPPDVNTAAVTRAGIAPSLSQLLSAPVLPHPKLPVPRAPKSCTSVDGFPDRNCTPGVTSPLVTQANIRTTICVAGYSAKVRSQFAPTSYTNALKAAQIVEYGFTDKNLHDYEEDHLISLELGGHPNDPRNLWPEPGNSPNPKDTIENLLKTRVCSGEITLIEAQKAISTNWKAVQR